MNALTLLGAKMPHLIFTMLLALVISGMIAMLGGRTARERVYHAGYLFVSCMATVVAGSWFMYLLHG
jgi:hypothetical protein